MVNNFVNDFLKVIKRMSDVKTSSPAYIDGVSGLEEITRMWQKHLCDLYDCVRRPSFGEGETDNKEDVLVSSEEIYDVMD